MNKLYVNFPLVKLLHRNGPRRRSVVEGKNLTAVGLGIPGIVYALFEIDVVVAVVFGKYYIKIDRKPASADSKT